MLILRIFCWFCFGLGKSCIFAASWSRQRNDKPAHYQDVRGGLRHVPPVITPNIRPWTVRMKMRYCVTWSDFLCCVHFYLVHAVLYVFVRSRYAYG